ncbi:MAG: prepilin-type N-terminal cleavage/methylation domain-containing protein, partial [Candidatus Jorgensenbacteria bacterium]
VARGFTLIELLVVIAILAVLAVAVVVVLNPAELIKQARDTTRVSDLAALNSAIALYLSDVTTPAIGTAAFCTVANATSTTTKGTKVCTTSTSTVVTGAGWVTIIFTNISSGSPLARLPMDPNNGSTNCGADAAACFYEYIPSDNTLLTFELDASMESTKYIAIETNDGGNNTAAYEVGNDPGLDL